MWESFEDAYKALVNNGWKRTGTFWFAKTGMKLNVALRGIRYYPVVYCTDCNKPITDCTCPCWFHVDASILN